MKFSFYFCFVLTFHVSAAMHSQNKVSLHTSNITLAEVFEQIKKQTGLEIIYSNAELDDYRRVDATFENQVVDEVLNSLLEGTNMEVLRMDNYFIIRPMVTENQIAAQDDIIVKGQVLDDQGLPVPGANVILLEYNTGTITDVEGRYEIKVPEGKGTLIVSFIGFQKQEIEVKGQTEINIKLKLEVSEIEDVVVTGYFKKSKESFTGAEISISQDEIQKVASLNVIQALSAFDPSVRIEEDFEYGSDPNRVPELTVRGENGFDLRGSADGARSNPNSPLFILDGVAVSPERVYDLNMNRVESMTILKDASATALYGSRGANGVIVITTKRPKTGEIRITFDTKQILSVPDLRDYNLMNASEKLEYELRAGLFTDKLGNYENQVRLDQVYNEKLKEVLRGVDTYWLAEPLQTSLNQRYSLDFEGGDQRFRYGINLRYDDDQGVMIGSGRDRYGLGIIFNYNIGENFFIRNDVLVDDVNGQNSPYGSFQNFAIQNPLDRKTDEFGNYTQLLSSNTYNPLIDATLPNLSTSKYTSIQDNFNIDWLIRQSFRVQGRFSYTKQLNKNEDYRSPFATEFAKLSDPDEKGSYQIRNSTTHSLDGNLTLAYNKSINKHTLNVGVGSNLVSDKTLGEGFTAVGFVNDDMSFVEFAAGYKENSTPTGQFDASRMIGFFGNLNYGFGDRYFVDMSYRTDGSSRFGKDSRFAPFWSAGFAWNLHKESWWGSKENTMKFRSSVGSTGNTNFSASQALTTYNYSSNYEYNGVYGAVLMGYGNSTLKWQNTLSYNLGLDVSLFKGKVVFFGDAYIKITENLLLPIDVAPSTGFTSYVENLGEMKNTGIEGRFRFNIVQNRTHDFDWSLTVAAFHNRNVIQKLSNALDKMNEEANEYDNLTGPKPLRTYQTGRSQSALMVVRSVGIDPATGNEVFIKLNGDLTFDYDFRDKVIVGDTKPKISGNFISNLDWKGFNCYLVFNYKYGGKIYNSTLATKVEGANPLLNADRRVLYDRWKEAGDEAVFRRIDDTSKPYQTTRLVEDDNLLNLQTLSLSYDMPQKLANKMYAERVKLIASTTNVFRLSTIKQERGTEYPFANTFTFGLNVEF